jgi:serine/threonine-protein kinase
MSSFDAYTNRAELGRGGMSTVYRATAPGGGTVALKVLAIHLAADRNALVRFQNEIRLLEDLEHPNIVRLLGADLRCNPPYLVMEYVEGMSLDRWVTQQGVLSVQDLGPLLSDVGRALDYAHDEGIIHRDVKPSNILIRRSTGRALLTDFGVAKSADVTAFTATHARVGSVYYMSPEQVEGRLELTRASDVYSLGVTAYLALTGRHPFEGTNEISIARKHLETTARHLSEIAPEVPRRVGDVVMRALEKQPHRRHETAGDFARRFRAAVAAHEAAEQERTRRASRRAPRGERAAVPAPVPVAQPPRRSRRRSRRTDGWVPFTLAVFAVVCCALGVVGISALSSTVGAWPFAPTALPPPIVASTGSRGVAPAAPYEPAAPVTDASATSRPPAIPTLAPVGRTAVPVVVVDERATPAPALSRPTGTPSPTSTPIAFPSPTPAEPALPDNLWPLP